MRGDERPMQLRAPSTRPLAHLCSWPACAPRGTRLAAVTLERGRDTTGSAMWSLELSPLSVPQCHHHSPLVPGDPGAPSSP